MEQKRVRLTDLASGTGPSGGASAVKLPGYFLARATVGTWSRGTWVVHDAAVEARKSLGTRAHVPVRSRVLARAAVLTWFQGATCIQI